MAAVVTAERVGATLPDGSPRPTPDFKASILGNQSFEQVRAYSTISCLLTSY